MVRRDPFFKNFPFLFDPEIDLKSH
jgi:hypothetical protein